MERVFMIFLLGIGFMAGEEIGFQRGFEEGVNETQAVAAERGDCFCSSECCGDHAQRRSAFSLHR